MDYAVLVQRPGVTRARAGGRVGGAGCFVGARADTTTTPASDGHPSRARRDTDDKHAAAMRNLFNRFLGCLYHCLQTGQTFDPAKAFPTRPAQQSPPAAA